MATEERIVDLSHIEPANPEGALMGLQEERQVTAGGVQAPSVEVPEKFRNKSLEDIIASYKELESQYGRQGQELGELRKVADQYIMSHMQSRQEETVRSERKPEIDFDSLPEAEKIDAILEQKMAPVKQAYAELQKEKFLAKINQSHPDFMDIAREKEFQTWVLGSDLRKEMFTRADRNYDYSSADELLSMWKTIKGINTQERQAQSEQTNSAFTQGRVETGIVEDSSPRKIYRRADIIALKMKDPKRYAMLEPEIRQAYAEGRVR